MKKRSKVGKKVALGVILLAFIICAASSTAVGIEYKRFSMDKYYELAFDYADTIAALVDGDKIAAYLESCEADDDYYHIQDTLVKIHNNSQLEYCYVFVPTDTDVVYLWSATEAGDSRILGYHERYMKGGKEASYAEYSVTPARALSITKDEVYGYIASAYAPIFNSAGEPVALAGADISMLEAQRALVRFMLLIAGSIAGVLIVLNFLFYYLLRKKLLDPIRILDASARDMTKHLADSETISLDIHTGDEIENLAHSFEDMFTEVREYIARLNEVTAEKERIGAELDIARGIQASMLPAVSDDYNNHTCFSIAASMEPAKEVGGDFFDFFMVDERHLAIVAADVSGKGVPAALFMVIGKTLIKDHTVPESELGSVFTDVNRLLCEANSESMFITAFEGVLDLVTGELIFVNAGHELPFISRAGGEFSAQKIRAGFVLGGMEGMRYRAGSIKLEPGDVLFQYTDGITEATNENNELFGMERLEKALNGSSSREPDAILNAVKDAAAEFTGKAPQFDDMTMLCLAYRAAMEE